MKTMFGLLLVLVLSGSAAVAQGLCVGCTTGNGVTSQQLSPNGLAPQRHAVAGTPRYCQSTAPYCLEADSAASRLTLYRSGVGVIAWDVIMRDPGRVLRGYISEIDYDPSWCPPASVRRKFPNLPAGCLPPRHPLNAMGEVKILMNGDFAGTAIRIHDTRGFGSQWPNEDSAGCVRVLNLKQEVLPRISFGRNGAVEVIFF